MNLETWDASCAGFTAAVGKTIAALYLSHPDSFALPQPDELHFSFTDGSTMKLVTVDMPGCKMRFLRTVASEGDLTPHGGEGPLDKHIGAILLGAQMQDSQGKLRCVFATSNGSFTIVITDYYNGSFTQAAVKAEE